MTIATPKSLSVSLHPQPSYIVHYFIPLDLRPKHTTERTYHQIEDPGYMSNIVKLFPNFCRIGLVLVGFLFVRTTSLAKSLALFLTEDME